MSGNRRRLDSIGDVQAYLASDVGRRRQPIELALTPKPPAASTYEDRINAQLAVCGCREARLAGLVGLLGSAVFVIFTTRLSWVLIPVVTILVAVASAGVARLVVLALAQWRLSGVVAGLTAEVEGMPNAAIRSGGEVRG